VHWLVVGAIPGRSHARDRGRFRDRAVKEQLQLSARASL
jgi:hypothetical protein